MTGSNILLIVAPLSASLNDELAPDATIELALAVVGELRERGWDVLVHADATISVAIGLSMLELRPDLSMERNEEPRGKVHIVPQYSGERPEWRMLMKRNDSEDKNARPESLLDILQATGLVIWQESVGDLLDRCKAVMTIGSHPDFISDFQLPPKTPRIVVCGECREGESSIKEHLLVKQRGLSVESLGDERYGPSPSNDIFGEETQRDIRRQRVAFRQAQWLVAINNLVDTLTSSEDRDVEW